MTTIKDITNYLETIAPLSLQESYDNCGLIVGDPSMEVKGITICLDSTEEVIMEAKKSGCNLVIAHHPIIFSGLKKLNGKNYIERTVITAIKNDVAIYAAHTNMDNIIDGVNRMIAEKIGLVNLQILAPKAGLLRKLVVFCPHDSAQSLRQALFAAGAGTIGNYDECSFNVEGQGSFRPGENSNPFDGVKGQTSHVSEIRIEVIYESYKEKGILAAMKSAHPYEEVAHDIYSLNNEYQAIGSGILGELPENMEEMSFLKHVKEVMKAGIIRYTEPTGKKVKRVAICGGSGSILLNDALKAEAQVFITADYKYHQFFDAEGKIVIADIGHFESEQFTMELFKSLILKKFLKFAVRLTEVKTNPVNYL
jgi:dinuclear metal center YbgI/SA1388 family protein